MKLIRFGLAASAALLFSLMSGCAYTPIAMQVSGQEEVLMGEAGGGDFHMQNLNGLSCGGTYNLLSNSQHLVTEVKCNDGRTGKVQVLRVGRGLTNGSGVGVLNDGTKIRILLGDMVHYMGAQGVWEKQSKEKF